MTEDADYTPPAEDSPDEPIEDAASDNDSPPTPEEESDEEEYEEDSDEDVAFEEMADAYNELRDLFRLAEIGQRANVDSFVKWVNSCTKGKRQLAAEKTRTGRLNYFYILEDD